MTVPGAINSERRNAPPQRRGNRFGEGWSFGNLLGGTAEDWENDMTTFITQARFTKDGLNGMIAAPGDRTEDRWPPDRSGRGKAYRPLPDVWGIRHSAHL